MKFEIKKEFRVLLLGLFVPFCIMYLSYFLVSDLKLEYSNKIMFFVFIFLIVASVYVMLMQYNSQSKDFINFNNRIKVDKFYLLLLLLNKRIISGYRLIKFPQISIVDYKGEPIGQSLIIIKLKKRINIKQKIYFRLERNKEIDLEKIMKSFNNEIFQSENIEKEFVLKVTNLFHVNYLELEKHKMIISVIEGYINDEDKNKLILKLEETGVFLNNYGII